MSHDRILTIIQVVLLVLMTAFALTLLAHAMGVTT